MGMACQAWCGLTAEPSSVLVQAPANDAYGRYSYGLLKRMHRLKRLRPFDLFFVPVLAAAGQPANVDPQHYMLVTPFEPDQSKWMDAVCFNIDDPTTRENTN